MPVTSACDVAAERARASLRVDIARGRARAQPLLVLEQQAPRPYEGGGAGVELEQLVFKTDGSPQGRVPCVVLRPADPTTPVPQPRRSWKRPALGSGTQQPPPGPQSTQQQQQQQQQQPRRPAVVLLHATNSCKEALLPRLAAYAARGYVAASIDNRYHGERASAGDDGGASSGVGAPGDAYQRAIVRAWRGATEERPFLLDTAWDVTHLLDLLEARPDVDARRIGMGGISLGGMLTWLVAVADDRVAVSAPSIGVQGWGWAVRNDSWQARLGSIPLVGPAAAADLGLAAPDARVVEALWRKLMPGLLDDYDTPKSLLAVALRPFLAINGELDPRCPLPGVREAFAAAAAGGYAAAGAEEGALQLRVFGGVGHEFTAGMAAAEEEFFADWL